MGYEILSEREELIVLKTRRSHLVSDIIASGFYAITCDESCGISKIEHLRHCSNAHEVCGDLIEIFAL